MTEEGWQVGEGQGRIKKLDATRESTLVEGLNTATLIRMTQEMDLIAITEGRSTEDSELAALHLQSNSLS